MSTAQPGLLFVARDGEYLFVVGQRAMNRTRLMFRLNVP